MLHGHTEWSGRWSITTGILEARRDVADGVLFDLSLWATSIIGLAVQCPEGKYFGLIRVPTNVYHQVLEFLKRNRGRKLREVKDGDVDISDVNSVGPVAKYSNAPVRSVMAIWGPRTEAKCRRSTGYRLARVWFRATRPRNLATCSKAR
jgi:hypothetical protein